MTLPQRAVEKFQAAYKQDFGEEISFGEAELMLSELILFLRLLLKKPDKPDLSTGTLDVLTEKVD